MELCVIPCYHLTRLCEEVKLINNKMYHHALSYYSIMHGQLQDEIPLDKMLTPVFFPSLIVFTDSGI